MCAGFIRSTALSGKALNLMLNTPQPVVKPFFSQQHGMSAFFYDLSSVQDQNLILDFEPHEAVGDDEERFSGSAWANEGNSLAATQIK